tara:strand:+ start:83 stop:2683 length:2601 start_codon:yes stop_codon:yes gene_type:complete
MDRVNIISEPLFERFKQFMKNKDDIWKNDEWWNALELKLTYEYRSICPLEESHLLTLGSLIAFHIWRREEPLIGTAMSRDHLIETIVYATKIDFHQLMTGFVARKFIEFIVGLIQFLKATPQWNNYFNYAEHLEPGAAAHRHDAILPFSENSEGQGIEEIITGSGTVVEKIQDLKDEIVNVVIILEEFVTKAYGLEYGSLDYYDELFENVVKRVTFERKTNGLLSDNVINDQVENFLSRHEKMGHWKPKRVDGMSVYWMDYVLQKIKLGLSIDKDSFDEIIEEAWQKLKITPKKGNHKEILSEIFIKIYGEDNLPNDYHNVYYKYIILEGQVWSKILENKKVMDTNFNKIFNRRIPLLKDFAEQIYDTFEKELHSLIKYYKVLSIIKIKILRYRLKGNLSPLDVKRIELYNNQSIKIHEIFIWIRLINSVMKSTIGTSSFFNDKRRSEIIETIENYPPHPYILKKMMAHILFLESELAPSTTNPPMAPYQHLELGSSEMDARYSDEEEIQGLEGEYYRLLNDGEGQGLVYNPDFKKMEELIQKENLLKQKLLEDKMVQYADKYRGAREEDIERIKGLQRDMLEGRTNVYGDELPVKEGSPPRAALLAADFPERELYVKNIEEGEGDKDKCVLPEEERISTPVSQPSSKPTPEQKKWLQEYGKYDMITDDSQKTTDRGKSWVWGKGPAESSEYPAIKNRLLRKYMNQQRKALLTGRRFGPAITGAANIGRTWGTRRRPRGTRVIKGDDVRRAREYDRRHGQSGYLQNRRIWSPSSPVDTLLPHHLHDSDLVRRAVGYYTHPSKLSDPNNYQQLMEGLAGSHAASLAAEKLGWNLAQELPPPRSSGELDQVSSGGGKKKKRTLKKKRK